MANQRIIPAEDGYAGLDRYLEETGAKKLFLVCDESLRFLGKLDGYFTSLPERMGIEVVRFDSFKPNPLYESVVRGVSLFRETDCGLIAAVGGGSAIDVAKCVKLYAEMDPGKNYLEQEIVPNGIPLLAIPTTAGTGSEATRYAVIYYRGEKQSVTHDSIIPSAVLMDPSVLETLPSYQKKSTMLDALCHAVESFWSVNRTEESRAYSRAAIRLILENKDRYLAGEGANGEMLRAAYTAGQAINITQTTAGHAMCYKLTSLYGVAHGHAAALCATRLFPYMLRHTGDCIDPRGEESLKETFRALAEAFGCETPGEAAGVFDDLVGSLRLGVPAPKEEDFDVLKTSVNPVRLKNNPVRLDTDAIEALYREILSEQRREKEGAFFR